MASCKSRSRTSIGQGRAHFAGEIEPVRIDVGDHDFARAGHFRDRHRHATDRAGAGDEHIFADEIEGERGVNGVAQRIRTGDHIERNFRIAAPEICVRNGDVFRETARPIHADAFGVRTKMAPAGEAISAMSTDDVAFGRDQFAFLEIAHGGADFVDHADKFMPDHHRHRDRLLGPRVPVINVNVGPADRSFLDADENVVRPDLGHRNFLQS